MKNEKSILCGDVTSEETIETAFLLRFHAIFCLVSAVALRTCLIHSSYEQYEHNGNIGDVDGCNDVGNTLSLLVAYWHIIIFVQSVRWYPRLLSYYRFLLPFSLFQVLPDLFLVKFHRTLHFPINGSTWMICDAVSPCMAGMWSIPGLMVLYLSYPNDTYSTDLSRYYTVYIKATCASLFILGLAEQLFPFIWHPTEQVKIFGWGKGIALYVLPAEALLGPTIVYAYHVTKDGPWWYSTIGAAMTMLVYTGSLSIGLLAIEVLS